MGNEFWFCFFSKSGLGLGIVELFICDCLSKFNIVVGGCFFFRNEFFCWDISLFFSVARLFCFLFVGRSMLVVGGNMVFKVLCFLVLLLLVIVLELLLLLLLLLVSLFWFVSCVLVVVESKLFVGKEVVLCWFKIWFKGIFSKLGWFFIELFSVDVVGKVVLFGVFSILFILVINGLGIFLYWWCLSDLVEGFDGIDGFGDFIVDFGDLGGILILL